MNNIDISLILAQLFNFLILFFLFKYFIAEKLHRLIEKKRLEAEKLEKAEMHFQEMQELSQKKYSEMIEQARKTSQKLKDESEKMARIQAEKIIQDANSRVVAILEGGKREIEIERKTMLSQMRSYIIDVSLKLSQRVLGDAAPNREFLEKEYQEIK